MPAGERSSNVIVERVLLAAIALAWAVSLLLPAAAAGATAASGLELLARGWRAAESGVFAWYANPLFVAAWWLALRDAGAGATVLAALACLLALTSFAAAETARRAGVPIPPLSFSSGFYLWLTAQHALLVLSSMRVWRRRRALRQSDARDHPKL